MTDNTARIQNLHRLTARLIWSTLGALLGFGLIFASSYYLGSRLMVTWVVFSTGIIGGFVSIQQRVKNISDEELVLISGSWFQILLIPIFGAIFALVLYCIFLTQIATLDMFPKMVFPEIPETGPDEAYIVKILQETYPASGQDLAKIVFWSFVAGFAERFVPQIITKMSAKAG
ncbi:MAG: hypothetical protein WBA51_18305 [Erythrobacter sp.]